MGQGVRNCTGCKGLDPLRALATLIYTRCPEGIEIRNRHRVSARPESNRPASGSTFLRPITAGVHNPPFFYSSAGRPLANLFARMFRNFHQVEICHVRILRIRLYSIGFPFSSVLAYSLCIVAQHTPPSSLVKIYAHPRFLHSVFFSGSQ